MQKPTRKWYADSIASAEMSVIEYQLNLDAAMRSTQNDFHGILKAKNRLKIQHDHLDMLQAHYAKDYFPPIIDELTKI